jgi:hypothetical protein
MEEIIGFVFGGAMLGLCTGIGVSKLKPSRKRIKYKEILKFQPDYFDEDPNCATLFIRLQYFRNNCEEAFDNAGDAADSIFLLVRRYNEAEITWDEKYNYNANQNFVLVENSLEEFALKSRYFLYDVPVNNINEMDEKYSDAETNPLIKDTYSKMNKRMDDGLETFKMITEIKNEIIKCLKMHILRLR